MEGELSRCDGSKSLGDVKIVYSFLAMIPREEKRQREEQIKVRIAYDKTSSNSKSGTGCFQGDKF
jgi:hypothetical protein